MPRLVSLAIIVLLILFLGGTFYQVVTPFLLPLFLAGVVAIIFQPVYRKFLIWTNQRVALSAGLTTASAVVSFLVPLALGIFFATGELIATATAIRTSPEFSRTMEQIQSEPVVQQIVERLQPVFGSKLDQAALAEEIEIGLHDMIAELVRKTLGMAGGAALSLLGNAFGALIGAGMFLIALYYFLSDGPRLIIATENLIPVKIDYQRQLFLQFEKAVRAVVISTFFAAAAQGLCTAIALYFFGFHRFFLLLFLTTFASMIPLAGAWLIWFPCAGWLAYSGHWGLAIALAIYGSVVIGMLDNLIRTYILHTDVKLHPLLAFISVLGGVQVMGLWGVFVAPIVASCLHALVLIFNTELKELSRTQFDSLRKTFSRKKTETPSEESPATPETEALPGPTEAVTASEKPVTPPQTQTARKRKRGKSR